MENSVLAIAAHPDDIEFVMAGTLLQLVDRGWTAHYFNIANGCCGSMTLDRETCAATRLEEARLAAESIPAKFYPPICNDLEIFYELGLLKQVVAVIRQAKPQIILTHAPIDYMEDHQNACRLAVSAAFTRGMPNVVSDPPLSHIDGSVTIYHAQPHGNRTPLGELVTPSHFVDVSRFIDKKTTLLRCHASQESWLDNTQKLSSYVQTLIDLNSEVGGMSQQFPFAEGWRKRSHLGFCGPNDDPLRDALGDAIKVTI